MPGFTGVAVNVTFVPEQIAPEGFAEIATLAATLGLTVMVIVFDVTGLPPPQVELLVISHVIRSPLTRALLEYVTLFVPTLVPFFFH